MTQKTSLNLLIFGAIFLAIGAFAFRLNEYKPLFPDEEEFQKLNDKTVNIPIFPDDPIVGNSQSAKNLVIFHDFGCTKCAEEWKIIKILLERHPDEFKIIFKGLPVTRLPFPSDQAERYAYCANEQKKFVEMSEQIFDNQTSLEPEFLDFLAKESGLDEDRLALCLASTRPDESIERTKIIATALGIQSVPAIFLNQKQIVPGAFVESWESALNL